MRFNGDMSEELQKKYYLIKFRILQEEYYTFWYTDDIDGFLLDINGILKSFPTKEEAIDFTEKQASAILELRLQKLVGLEIDALQKEYAQILKNIHTLAYLTTIIIKIEGLER